MEKAEYWAVVWGAVVMAGSGLLLWANNLAMRFLPKTWLDVATSVHFYEAVLATLAIVVWHFYSVIFDPDVYPLNTAFLTGAASRRATQRTRNPNRSRETDKTDMTTEILERAGDGSSPLIYLSNNWISLAGVILVTTATIFWLFLLPTTLRGETSSPYIGILVFMGLPGPFFAGLILIPLGIWLKRKRSGRHGHLSAGFPPLDLAQHGTAPPGLFPGRDDGDQHRYSQPDQLRRGELHGFGDLLRADLPHRDAAGIHRLPEFSALAGGMREVPYRAGRGVVRAQQTVGRRPGVRRDLQHLPAAHSHARSTTCVPRARPANSATGRRNTARTACRVIPKYAEDEANTLTKTVLLMKIGGGNGGSASTERTWARAS